MANLTSQANRMNDVEINNNKPVSSSVFRRIGSNVNYLLDFLGVTDGATSTTSPLGTISQAKTTLSYSLSLDNSVIGTARSLFTFNGGDERVIRYYATSDGVAIYGSDDMKPIKIIADYLSSFNQGGVGAFGLLYTIQLDSFTVCSITVGLYGEKNTTQIREITVVPSGSHTVKITKHTTTTNTPNITGSLSYIFI